MRPYKPVCEVEHLLQRWEPLLHLTVSLTYERALLGKNKNIPCFPHNNVCQVYLHITWLYSYWFNFYFCRKLSASFSKSDELKHIENDYVKNLQQQIYFLELEANYLREQARKATEMHPQMTVEAERMLTKLRVSFTHPFDIPVCKHDFNLSVFSSCFLLGCVVRTCKVKSTGCKLRIGVRMRVSSWYLKRSLSASLGWQKKKVGIQLWRI